MITTQPGTDAPQRTAFTMQHVESALIHPNMARRLQQPRESYVEGKHLLYVVEDAALKGNAGDNVMAATMPQTKTLSGKY